MKRIYSLILILSFIFSCKKANNQNEKPVHQTKVKSMASDIVATGEKTDELQSQAQIEVEGNILHAKNKKFVIKIDRLMNGKLVYRSWNQPKSLEDNPDLSLKGGKIEAQGTGGGFHYVFHQGDWQYILENNLMAESEEGIGVFIKVLKNEKEQLYQKMTNLTLKKNYDLASYSETTLIGMWWTPHYAVRKIYFDRDELFTLKNGDKEEASGNFTLTGKKVKLYYETGEESILILGGGKENTSFTLIGDGENFVKEWEERK